MAVNETPQHDIPERFSERTEPFRTDLYLYIPPPAAPIVEWTPAGLRVSGGLWEPHEALALAEEIQKRYGGRGG